MSRFDRRRDRNHAEIRDGLRACGINVLDLGGAGCGVPDLLAKRAGQSYWLEVKDPKQPPSKRALTRAETLFAAYETVHVVMTLDDALRAVGLGRVQ